jgi:hypothetical protein
MKRFTTPGFHKNSSALPGEAATHAIEQMALRFHRMLTGFVQGACMPESDPFACAKAKTLRDTVAIGG